MFYFSFIFFFPKENVIAVWFFNMCLQSYPKIPLKSKMQLLSQEFVPLYLNALIRTREYRMTFFYHNTRSKPMFFHISATDLIVENWHLTGPNREPLYHFTMKASTMISYSLNAIDLSQSHNQRILECSSTFPELTSPHALSPSATLCQENKLFGVTLLALSHTLALTHATSDWMPILQPHLYQFTFPGNSKSFLTASHTISVLVFLVQLKAISFFPGNSFSNFLSQKCLF